MTIIPQKLLGDCRATLRTLPEKSVHTCITSPPYFGLREYLPKDHPQKHLEIGCEKTFKEYLEHLVEVFREVRRVLRDDGTLWINLGDAYANDGKWGGKTGGKQSHLDDRQKRVTGLKSKDLLMMPERVAMALQAPYVVPSCIKLETEKAWLAAMFDGEGCIGIRRFDSYKEGEKKQDGFVVYTVVTNNDVELLNECIDITGLGSARIKQHANTTDERGIVSRRDSYGWRLDGNKAVDVLRAIYPYLIAKKKQAAVAFTLDVLNKSGRAARGNGPVPAELQEKRAYLKELINRLNQRQSVDVPTWVEEPKPKIEPGWYLRSKIPWIKRNPLPESVEDRPGTAIEYVFLLSKSEKYYYDRHAVMMGVSPNTNARVAQATLQKQTGGSKQEAYANVDLDVRHTGVNPKAALHEPGTNRANRDFSAATVGMVSSRNRRNSDWFMESWQGMLVDDEGDPLALIVNPVGTRIMHFASYPPKLVEPLILCSTSEKGCCPQCGAQYRRVIVKGKADLAHQKACGADANGNCGRDSKMTATDPQNAQRRMAQARQRLRAQTGKHDDCFDKPATAGHEPDCECSAPAPVPCTVLDPFSGTGCTAMVATRLGRRSIGCELNPEYFAMSSIRDGQTGLALL